MRYLCCADLHLGAGADLMGPGERLAEQREVWRRVLEIAVERECEAVLFAGDAFHRNKPTPDELLAFAEPLADCPLPVYAINGNSHDFVGVGRAMAVDVVHNLSTRFSLYTEPAVVELPGGATLACLPWTPVSHLGALQDSVGRDDLNERAADLLIDVARTLDARCYAPKILMTHFAISGDWDGIAHVAREPVLPLEQLERLGFGAIVAGHFHRRQMLATDPAEPEMPIFYCGSPAPLNFGEGGHEHGCWILDSHEAAPGVIGWGTSFIPIESRPFVTIDFDLDRNADIPGLSPLLTGVPIPPEVKDGAYVKLRVTATEDGARTLDQDDLRLLLEEAGARRVWIELDVERAHRERGVAIADGVTPMEQLEAYLAAAGVNGDQASAMLARAARYLT